MSTRRCPGDAHADRAKASRTKINLCIGGISCGRSYSGFVAWLWWSELYPCRLVSSGVGALSKEAGWADCLAANAPMNALGVCGWELPIASAESAASDEKTVTALVQS
jgi:hypothetical protein